MTMCQKCRRIKEDELSDNPLELVSTITEFNDIHEFMQDPGVDRAMHLVIKLTMEKGRISHGTAQPLIVELQALATEFALKATYYATIGKKGTDESHRKNTYFTMKDSITKLCDALKYTARDN